MTELVPSWRPSTASDPDEADAWRFEPLADRDPACAQRLIEHFAPSWLAAARLPAERVAEVADTLNLVVAESWDPADGTQTLRITPWYTGETRWLPEWDGAAETALSWIEQTAEDFGDWVIDERERYGNRTPWDPN